MDDQRNPIWFYLGWKRGAIAEAGRPTTKTLRPDLDEVLTLKTVKISLLLEIILEVLKILQKNHI